MHVAPMATVLAAFLYMTCTLFRSHCGIHQN